VIFVEVRGLTENCVSYIVLLFHSPFTWQVYPYMANYDWLVLPRDGYFKVNTLQTHNTNRQAFNMISLIINSYGLYFNKKVSIATT